MWYLMQNINTCTHTGSVPVFFLLLRNLPMGFSSSDISTRLVTACTRKQSRAQGVTDVLSAQVGSRTNTDDPMSLQDTPVGLNFTFMTFVNSTLESHRCVYWNFSEPWAIAVLKVNNYDIDNCDSIGNGSWTTAGITTDDVMTQSTKSGPLTTITCRSTHLTSFAVLVDVVGGLEVKIIYYDKLIFQLSVLACLLL